MHGIKLKEYLAFVSPCTQKIAIKFRKIQLGKRWRTKICLHDLIRGRGFKGVWNWMRTLVFVLWPGSEEPAAVLAMALGPLPVH